MFKYWWIIIGFSLGGCKTLELGGGLGYHSGQSGGCPGEASLGGGIEIGYYPQSLDSGLGVGLQLATPGYTDCNDGDPMIYLSPRLYYRLIVTDQKWNLRTGVGYNTGVFVDPGYVIISKIQYTNHSHLFIEGGVEYYSAFTDKKNAIRPGRSFNLGVEMAAGVCF